MRESIAAHISLNMNAESVPECRDDICCTGAKDIKQETYHHKNEKRAVLRRGCGKIAIQCQFGQQGIGDVHG